jgi:putative ABC transport system substrate-binding protein
MTMRCSTVGGIITLFLGLLATPGAVAAQPAQHVPRIGYLSGCPPAANAARVAAFRQGLRELVPRLSRVAALGMSDPLYASRLHEIERAAGALQVQLQLHSLDVRSPGDIERAFKEARAKRADAVVVLASPILEAHRTEVAALAAQYRLPTIYHVEEFVEAGGLMSYGVSFLDLYRRAATYVDKVLKGATPADLPVEQPTKFELVINLKTAKALDLPIPPILLLQADKVIE